ncbi:MAG: FeoB small GTPase domain-containing protein, partial [Oscillospiraceae bacterium]
AIINIVDATNPERSLYLSLQLLELDIPLVMALNMMDEVKKNNYFIDINGLEKNLRIKIVPVTAVKNDGIDELIAACKEAVQSKSKACRSFFYNGASERAIEQVAQLIEARAIA